MRPATRHTVSRLYRRPPSWWWIPEFVQDAVFFWCTGSSSWSCCEDPGEVQSWMMSSCLDSLWVAGNPWCLAKIVRQSQSESPLCWQSWRWWKGGGVTGHSGSPICWHAAPWSKRIGSFAVCIQDPAHWKASSYYSLEDRKLAFRQEYLVLLSIVTVEWGVPKYFCSCHAPVLVLMLVLFPCDLH